MYQLRRNLPKQLTTNKGINKMTTENTVTVEVTKTEAELYADSILSVELGLEETRRSLIRLFEKQQSQRTRIDQLDSAIWKQRDSKEEIISTIKKFIIEHIANEDSADIDELKELAEELEIELTKKIKVTFHVDYEVEIECDLDYVVDESEFEVSLNYSGQGEEDITTEDMLDFEVEEDN
jgi:hypothetical protein